jgi:hypothetical protein
MSHAGSQRTERKIYRPLADFHVAKYAIETFEHGIDDAVDRNVAFTFEMVHAARSSPLPTVGIDQGAANKPAAPQESTCRCPRALPTVYAPQDRKGGDAILRSIVSGDMPTSSY